MRRGFLSPPVIIVLAIITFGVAAALYANVVLFKRPANEPPPTNQTPPDVITESTDETANWKIYTNSAARYQIKHPHNIELIEGPWEGEAISGSLLPPAEVNYGVTFKFSADGKETLQISNANNFDVGYGFDPKISADAISQSSATPAKINEIQFSGRTAYKIVPENQDFGSVFIILLKGQNDNSGISILTGVKQPHQGTIDTMLSTFKFLD